MATYKVFAPFSGTITGLDNYCSGGAHASPIYDLPTDIGAGGVIRSVWFVGSSTITKIVVTRVNGYLCKDSTIPCPVDCGLKVKMYNASNVYIGAVYYGHTAYWVASGTYYPQPILGNRGWPLAQTPDKSKINKCYMGMHSHMECSGGSRDSVSCNKYVYFATSPIYKFVK